MMSKIDQDCVKKCMEIKGEGGPRRTWLESLEMDMAELEIERDVHDKKKWR